MLMNRKLRTWRLLAIGLAGMAIALAADGTGRARAQAGKLDVLLTCISHGPGGSQVFRINSDGSGRKPVTTNDTPYAYHAFDPALSPDGKRVAFIESGGQDDRGEAGLCVMNVDGSGRKRIAEFVTLPQMPSWSPDGKRIAFCAAKQKGSLLCVVDADGRNFRQLGEVRGTQPVWSPDGKRVLFSGSDTDPKGLWVMDADGTNARALAPRAAMGAWSRDGKSLAYVVLTGLETRGAGLFVARADGSEPRPLIGGPREPVFGVQWSSEGKRLYFTREVKVPAKPGEQAPPRFDPTGKALPPSPPPTRSIWAVHVIDADGRNLRRVTNIDESEYIGGCALFAASMIR
jgi:Tol biopolymer transport system component